jgi:hypothetical protein
MAARARDPDESWVEYRQSLYIDNLQQRGYKPRRIVSLAATYAMRLKRRAKTEGKNR